MKILYPISMSVIFEKALNYMINILIIYIIIILVLSLGKTLYTIKILLEGHQIEVNLSIAITDILSFLVMIELFRLHSMIDPAIIFIVRELIVQLYEHDNLVNSLLIEFGILLLCLGVVRSLALLFSPEAGVRTELK